MLDRHSAADQSVIRSRVKPSPHGVGGGGGGSDQLGGLGQGEGGVGCGGGRSAAAEHVNISDERESERLERSAVRGTAATAAAAAAAAGPVMVCADSRRLWPHARSASSRCRRHGPAMLIAAAAPLIVVSLDDPSTSWFVRSCVRSSAGCRDRDRHCDRCCCCRCRSVFSAVTTLLSSFCRLVSFAGRHLRQSASP